MSQVADDETLYDSKILDNLNFSKFQSKFKPPISIKEPGNGLLVRSLHSSDFNAGFVELLGQLTTTGDMSEKQFIERFRSMQKCSNTYYITVVEDTSLGCIVGTASLVLEQKFIHQCALRGRVEDVVVSDKHRGKQLGKLLIATLVLLAEHIGVYKLTLDCRDLMVPFYQTFGYNKEPGNSNFMQIRFKA